MTRHSFFGGALVLGAGLALAGCGAFTYHPATYTPNAGTFPGVTDAAANEALAAMKITAAASVKDWEREVSSGGEASVTATDNGFLVDFKSNQFAPTPCEYQYQVPYAPERWTFEINESNTFFRVQVPQDGYRALEDCASFYNEQHATFLFVFHSQADAQRFLDLSSALAGGGAPAAPETPPAAESTVTESAPATSPGGV